MKKSKDFELQPIQKKIRKNFEIPNYETSFFYLEKELN